MSDEKSRPTGDTASLQAVKEPGGPITTTPIIPDNVLAAAYAYILGDQWGMDGR